LTAASGVSLAGSAIGNGRKITQKRWDKIIRLDALVGLGASGRQTSRGSCRSGVKNFDTLWQYRKAGQTAQAIDGWQVGRTSKFFLINLDA